MGGGILDALNENTEKGANVDMRRNGHARGQPPRCSFCNSRLGGRRYGQAGRIRACRNCAAVTLPQLLADAVLAGGEVGGEAADRLLGVALDLAQASYWQRVQRRLTAGEMAAEPVAAMA